ncbi:MAG: Rieske 2Fe-2S domain-containing protein [Bacteroidetes bacterium]|nr:Rieske 2Fe-2S domain-containing protein [Bacteroidota bacterium]
MKSTAHIKGHPIHPILVGFPIAFFTGTLIFDALGIFNMDSGFWQTGKYMEIAGIIAAVITAIPGTIDYFFTVPPKSSASSRGAKHGLLNVGLLVIFVIAFIIRTNDASWTPVILEAVGFILLLFSGWLGGTLVYRNQIGVDPRYADAGKWKEARFSQSSGLIEVAAADELETDQMKLLHIGDKRIVLGRTEKGYVAFSDHCSHKGGSLAGGMMMCGTVQCPWHGSQFDVHDGKAKAGPAKEQIPTYNVTVKEGKVFLKL